MCLSLTALDTRDGVVVYPSTQLWDAHCNTVYQVADLHTSDWTNKGLWVTPHQVGVGEPGEDHTQCWGAWRCKGWQKKGWRELREQYRVVRCSGASPVAVRLSIEHHGCQRWIASLDFSAPTHWPWHVSTN